MITTNDRTSETPGGLLFTARAMLALSIACLLVVWLVSLPDYFTRITLLTVATYSQAGEDIVSNALVQSEAAARGLSLPAYALYQIGYSWLIIFTFWFVAALILWRAQNQWYSWFTALILVGLGAVTTLLVFNVTQPLRVIMASVELLSWIVWPGMFTWLFLFPGSGAAPQWAWRLVLALQLVFLALSVQGFLAEWDMIAPGAGDFQFTLGGPLALITLGLIFYAQLFRYRGIYAIVEKQQVKWFVFGLVLLMLTVSVVLFLPSAEANPYAQDVGGIVLLVIPISIGIAILRYRLYDIDVIIRKTLVYAVLSGLLGLIYFGTVLLLQAMIGRVADEQSPLIIVVSTLLIAALFTPLRQRVQALIDRRFYRQKYDAQQVLAHFAQTARDEVSLEVLTAELTRIVQETMQPEQATIWLKKGRQ
jgi:hypothetical protein